MTNATRLYGWKPSLPDARDQYAFAQEGVIDTLDIPDVFSLRDELPAVLDQGQLGSCTANALAGLMQYHSIQTGTDMGVPSRLFIYYQERLREGTLTTDSGAYGRDGFASLRAVGVPVESLWPYDISQFTEKPSQEAYDGAGAHKIHHYTHARTNLKEVQSLILKKRPVAFGFSVPACFEGEQCMSTGVMPMPVKGEQYIGGHEVYAMGWKEIDGELYIECRNSWSASVMDEGNFWIPASFLFGGYASDFRAIQN